MVGVFCFCLLSDVTDGNKKRKGLSEVFVQADMSQFLRVSCETLKHRVHSFM